MVRFEFGVKVYNNDWFQKYELGYREAAWLLRDWGVTSVMARSPALGPLDRTVQGMRFDDRQFRDALAREGIAYWATACMFFDPIAVKTDPSLQAIGSHGRPVEEIDWYVGIPPSMDRFVAQQTATIEHAVRELEPDGVFLSFIRWPGFWEQWMPHHTRHDFTECSYDRHTLDRFAHEAGVDVLARDPADAAAWIEVNARDAWTAWKCQVITDVVRRVRAACRTIKPDVQIMLNTLPFRAEDYDNAREKVFGQHLEALADIVDMFEVMTYHQILKRPTSWIPQAGEEAKRRTRRKTVCTLQARPLYLGGIHAKENRSPTLSAEEFAEAVNGVENSSVDGVVVFVWSDLLEDALQRNDTRRVDAIRAAAERRQA